MARVARVPAWAGHEFSAARLDGQGHSGHPPALESFNHNRQLREVRTERRFRCNA